MNTPAAPVRTLHVEWPEPEVQELRVILDRAMNTLNPKDYPSWLQRLSDRVDQFLAPKEDEK